MDGSSVDLLDIVTVPMHAPAPAGHQTENHQIDDRVHWSKVGRATWEQIVSATDDIKGSLWSDGDSSRYGRNDKVSGFIAETLNGSLLLIEPSQLEIVVGSEPKWGGGSVRRVRARFVLNGTTYNFVVTDPWIERRFFASPDGSFGVEGSRLCVGLAEISNGAAVKLVAAIIKPSRI
ncbi:MAG: hypothetical protein FWD68_21145 [Alphaproteobacteria bacterium]|nr:hypothetical protein [Alphaproteobacteria bacterium]